MTRSFKKYFALALTIIMIIGVFALFSVRKQGMFIDEIYTYGLSNGYYMPFVTWIPGDEIVGNTITAQEFEDYLTVGAEDGFAFGSVYYNQACDVHPPLHYWLMNIVCSIWRTEFSKWQGLALNAVLYALTLFVLYKLAVLIFKSPNPAIAAVALYGLSTIGVSTAMMIRMYLLLTLLSLVLGYLIAQLIEKPRAALYPLVTLAVFAGLMTQYYFVFYAFFACAFYFFYALFTKQYRALICFTVSAFIGVALLPLLFPPFITQLFADKLVSGATAVGNMSDTSLYISRSYGFFRETLHRMKDVVYTAVPVLLLCAVFSKKIIGAFKEKKLSFVPLVVILPAFVAFPVVAIVSPVAEARYIYNLVPFFVLALCWLMYLIEDFLGENLVFAALIAVACLSLWEIRTIPPDYLYPEHAEYNAAADEYASSPCVYFIEGRGDLGPVTQDLLQLKRFDDVFFSQNKMNDALISYIDSHADNDRLVIYVSTDSYWACGYDAEEITEMLLSETEYTHAEELYKYALSDTILLTK